MHVSVYLPFVVTAAFGLVMPATTRRLPPRQATWTLCLGSALLALCCAGSLLLLAFSAVGRLHPVASLGHWTADTLARLDPVDTSVAVAACVAVLVISVTALRVAVRRVRAVVAAYRSAREFPDGRVVIVSTEGAAAYAIPGRRGRIVVPHALLCALTPAQQKALIAHEQSHLIHRHYLHRVTVDVAAAMNPLLRALPAAVRYATERWADEDAAAGGDRASTAAALATAGLAVRRHRPAAPGLVRPALDLYAAESAVPARVRALLGAPPARRPLLLVALVAVLTVAPVAALDATWDVHQLVERAQASTAQDVHR